MINFSHLMTALTVHLNYSKIKGNSGAFTKSLQSVENRRPSSS